MLEGLPGPASPTHRHAAYVGRMSLARGAVHPQLGVRAVGRRDGGPAARSPWAGVIKRLAPDLDAAHVEAWMRREHGELEDLEALYFAPEVKRAAERVRAAEPAERDRLARSFGLRPDSSKPRAA